MKTSMNHDVARALSFRVISRAGHRQMLMQEAASVLRDFQGKTDGSINEGSRGGMWLGAPVARLERIVDLLEDIEIQTQGD